MSHNYLARSEYCGVGLEPRQSRGKLYLKPNCCPHSPRLTATKNPTAIRRGMATFWKANSKEASLEEMMLNSDAKSIRSLEEPEVLASLPNIAGKDVVELACGIG